LAASIIFCTSNCFFPEKLLYLQRERTTRKKNIPSNNKMKNHTAALFILLATGGSLQVHAIPAIQPTPIDSLYQKAMSDNVLSSSEASQLLERLLEEEYADSADLAPSHSLRQQQTIVHGLIGEYFFDKGRFNRGLEASQKAVTLAREQNDSTLLLDLLSTQGACAMRAANYDEAVSSFEECIKLAERKGDVAALSSAYSNLAITYTVAATPENGYIDFAVTFIEKSIEIEEHLPHSPTLSIRYGAAAEIYTKIGRYDEAIRMGRKAYEMDSIAGNTLRMARRLSQTGDALFAKHDMKEAEQHYLRSMRLLEKMDDALSISINCKQLGDFYLAKGDRDKALQYWTRGLSIAEEAGNNNLRLALLQKMYKFFRGHDDAKAIVWLEQYNSLKDSIWNEQNSAQLRDYQIRYETAEKEIIINRQRQEIHQRNFALVLSVILLVILVITSILIHGLRQHKKKRFEAEQEVQELKNIISSQERNNIERLTHYVALHINEKILTNEDICNHLAISQSTLNRQLNAIRGVSIQGFVQEMRMEKAKHLLRTTKESISDIAAQCGYDDSTYFTRFFKQNCNMPPTKYRSIHQDKPEKKDEEKSEPETRRKTGR